MFVTTEKNLFLPETTQGWQQFSSIRHSLHTRNWKKKL